MSSRRPPRLLVKTLGVAFLTVAVLLTVVFIVVMLTVRNQVRQTVQSSLESTQRMFAAVETRRQHELRGQAETLAVTRPPKDSGCGEYQRGCRRERSQ